MLDILFESSLDAGFDDLTSSGCNPVCQFGCGCFIHQSVQISGKHVMISGKAFVFEHNEFKNCEFLALQQFPSLSGGGFVMHFFISGFPEFDCLLKNGCDKSSCPVCCFLSFLVLVGDTNSRSMHNGTNFSM